MADLWMVGFGVAFLLLVGSIIYRFTAKWRLVFQITLWEIENNRNKENPWHFQWPNPPSNARCHGPEEGEKKRGEMNLSLMEELRIEREARKSLAMELQKQKNAAAITLENVRNTAAMKLEEIKNAAAIKIEKISNAAAMQVEKIRNAAAFVVEKVRNSAEMDVEKERNIAASGAEESMVMIRRLEREKASVELEYQQFRRVVEQKQIHDEQDIRDLQNIVATQENEKVNLEKKVELYNLWLGYRERNDIDANNLNSSPLGVHLATVSKCHPPFLNTIECQG